MLKDASSSLRMGHGTESTATRTGPLPACAPALEARASGRDCGCLRHTESPQLLWGMQPRPVGGNQTRPSLSQANSKAQTRGLSCPWREACLYLDPRILEETEEHPALEKIRDLTSGEKEMLLV